MRKLFINIVIKVYKLCKIHKSTITDNTLQARLSHKFAEMFFKLTKLQTFGSTFEKSCSAVMVGGGRLSSSVFTMKRMCRAMSLSWISTAVVFGRRIVGRRLARILAARSSEQTKSVETRVQMTLIVKLKSVHAEQKLRA